MIYRNSTAAFILLVIVGLFYSCGRIKNSANKSGEAAGEVATEFFEGVSEGVEKTLENEVSLKNLDMLQTGKSSISSSNKGGNNNKLELYVIFNETFSDTLIAKSFDKNKRESGRTKCFVSGKKGDAGYFDFHFDQRTELEARSILTIERYTP